MRAVLIVVIWVVFLSIVALVAELARCAPASVRPTESVQMAQPNSANSSPNSAATAPTSVPRPVEAAATQQPSAQPPSAQPAPKHATEPGADEHVPGLGVLPAGVAPELEGLGVQVVQRSDGRAMTNARVRSMVQREIEELERQGFSLDTSDPEEMLAHAKTEMRSGATGFAIVPSEPGRMLVEARSGVLYGFAVVDRNVKSFVRLEISIDQDLVLQTVDPSGAPVAKMPVLLRDSSCTDLWRATTSGPAAQATLKHARFLIDRDASPGDAWAIVDAVAPGTGAAVLARTQLPGEPLQLTVEPGGRVVVRVLDVDGQRIASDVDVELATATLAAPCARRSTVRTKLSRATFERVGPGQELVATALGGDEFEDVSVNFNGPQVAGAAIPVDVRFLKHRPRADVRILDADGKPIGKRPIDAWLSLREGGEGSATRYEKLAPAATDQDGRARIVVRTTAPTASIVGLTLLLRPERSPLAYVELPLAHGLQPGKNDFGELRALELPALASGYVIDDRKSPVMEATIELAVAPSAPEPTTDVDLWRADPRFTARTDGRGKFQVRGLVNGAAIALSARAPDHRACDRVRVERGDQRVSLVLPRDGVIAGRILLPPRMPMNLIRLVIDRDGVATTVNVDPSGGFRLGDQAPGSVALSVFVDGRDEPVFGFDSLDVTPGSPARDSRLDPIDLRSRIWFAAVVVFDPAGARVPGGTVTVVERNVDGDETRQTLPLKESFASFVMLTPTYSATVTVDGYAPVELKDATGDREVHLAPERR